tara:strand:+ start:961 stop:1215 length:255 start_codon:yes stop_codon:yes gene_type:complete
MNTTFTKEGLENYNDGIKQDYLDGVRYSDELMRHTGYEAWEEQLKEPLDHVNYGGELWGEAKCFLIKYIQHLEQSNTDLKKTSN